MKKIIFTALIITIIFLNIVSAQRKLKYKDAYDFILKGNNEKSYSLLLEYQKQDPEFINTYFQLGAISYNWAKNYDPLTDMELVEYFIYNTKLFYGLGVGKLRADDKDARKNSDFYQNEESFKAIEKLEYEDVNALMNQRIEDIKKHDTYVHQIAQNFNQSIDYYNKCTKIFMEINQENTKIKDIYLAASTDLTAKIHDIITYYDSAIFFFEKYKTDIKNYPIKNYNQNLVIKQIETFRLEGLTSANFLEENILIWDYKSWATDLKDVIDKNIENLRKELVNTNKEIATKEITLAAAKGYSDALTGFELDEKLIFRIEKFDYQSIVSTLFEYRDIKVDMILQNKKTFNNYMDTINFLALEKKAKNHYITLDLYKKSDSLLNILQNRAIDKNIKKYNDFFTDNYAGATGIKKYPENEKKAIKTLLNTNFDNLRKSILFNRKVFQTDQILKFNTEEIYTSIKKPDFKTNTLKKYYTLKSAVSEKGEYYITGYYQQAAATQIFVAKTDKTKNVLWLKTTPISPGNFEYGKLFAYNQNDMLVVAHSENITKHKNFIYKFDNTGTQTYKIDIYQTKMPQYLQYDDINDNCLIVYKGTDFNGFYSKTDTITIEKMNLADKKLQWKKDIIIKGNVFDIVKIDTVYNVFCNFATYQDQTGATKTSKADIKSGSSNIVIIQITDSGNILKFKEINATTAFFGIAAIKIDSETINIVGLKTAEKDIYNLKLDNADEIYYQIINAKLENIYTN